MSFQISLTFVMYLPFVHFVLWSYMPLYLLPSPVMQLSQTGLVCPHLESVQEMIFIFWEGHFNRTNINMFRHVCHNSEWILWRLVTLPHWHIQYMSWVPILICPLMVLSKPCVIILISKPPSFSLLLYP